MTAREIIMEGNEGYQFRDVIDNLTEQDILDCMEEYAKQQRGYSEEGVFSLITDLVKNSDFIDFNKEYGVRVWEELTKWFEQFKNK